ncbi:MAG: hypothetical protein JXR22_13585 [Prolixibacteraceae bacterium]|nr:hypothetical protein [Prolixibacteraceae bacterium]
MKNKKLNILTFLGIALTMMVLGFAGVGLSVTKIRQHYIKIQLDSNKRTAEVMARLFDEKLGKGIEKADLIKSFQKSIEGSHIDEGYLCMFDQDEGVLLCHPDTNAIGMSMKSENFQFLEATSKMQNAFFDVVTSGKEEAGIFQISEPSRSEITYMVPVPGTTWKISVHENLEKAETMLRQLKLIAYGGFILLSLLISIIATFIVRKISLKHEKEMTAKNKTLAQKNIELKGLNQQVEEQNAIILKHAEKLEDEVAKRTSELQNIYSKLADLEKSKSDFLAVISHELRTPLNGIIGFSNILEEQLENTKHLEFVKRIKLSGNRLFKFSETALLITQLKAQEKMMESYPVPVKDTFNELWVSFSETVYKKNLAIQFNIEKDLHAIYGVPGLIKRCFANILENALKYSPENGSITVNFKQQNGQTCIMVSDDGPGFSNEALLRQFDLFGADKIMHRSEGFGLGLVACQLIMQVHSGQIKVENNKDQGATISLLFANNG